MTDEQGAERTPVGEAHRWCARCGASFIPSEHVAGAPTFSTFDGTLVEMCPRCVAFLARGGTGSVLEANDAVLLQIEAVLRKQQRTWSFEHDRQHEPFEWLGLIAQYAAGGQFIDAAALCASAHMAERANQRDGGKPPAVQAPASEEGKREDFSDFCLVCGHVPNGHDEYQKRWGDRHAFVSAGEIRQRGQATEVLQWIADKGKRAGETKRDEDLEHIEADYNRTADEIMGVSGEFSWSDERIASHIGRLILLCREARNERDDCLDTARALVEQVKERQEIGGRLLTRARQAEAALAAVRIQADHYQRQVVEAEAEAKAQFDFQEREKVRAERAEARVVELEKAIRAYFEAERRWRAQEEPDSVVSWQRAKAFEARDALRAMVPTERVKQEGGGAE